MRKELEPSIVSVGKDLLDRSVEKKAIFDTKSWYGKIMDWCMKNEAFKTKMFHFVDVLPSLRNNKEIASHVKEYFARDGEMPAIFSNLAIAGSFAPALMSKAIQSQVMSMSKMFITGESPKSILKILKKQRDKGIGFTVDLLGEVTLSEKEANAFQGRYFDLLNVLSDEADKWKNHKVLDSDANGNEIPKVNISIKLSALHPYQNVDVAAWDKTKEALKNKLRPIFEAVIKRGAFINVDMEHYGFKDLTFAVFGELICEERFKNYRHFGIVLQAYLRDSLKDLDGLLALSRKRGTPFKVRLVKGAYWDYERVIAEQKDWAIPVFCKKQESDLNFERCCYEMLKHPEHLELAVGSHNIRSISSAIAIAKDFGVPKKALEFQMLYGMTEELKNALVEDSYPVREYMTVGDLIPGMAYFVRRLLENTSNESFLRSRFSEGADAQRLLKNPEENLTPTADRPRREAGKFYNEAFIDFGISENREALSKAIELTKQEFGVNCPVILNGEEIPSSDTLPRLNPSHPNQIVANVSLATQAQAQEAVQYAKTASESWRKTSVEDRCQYLEKIADAILAERYRLSAIEIHEVGKPWKEADGDICEAVDFCRYYAEEMRRLAVPNREGSVLGENSAYYYQPKGVALVIAPWNFPLAILSGMVVAALVTGNTVVIKPAEQSSWIAYEFMKILKKVGLPKGVVQFVTGLGETVGEYLTGDKDINMIAFTGSKEVGLHIFKRSATLVEGQLSVKKCIIEMGGKNAIIVDSDADLDEAVGGILYGVFGFQGQKCSACSRVIVLESVYDILKERLVESAKSIDVDYAEYPHTYVGPVVDEEAKQRIEKITESAKAYGNLLFEGTIPKEGYFVPPMIFDGLSHDSALAQTELFGPVVALFKVKDIEEAVRLANDTAFGLTGALYSRSPKNVDYVRENFNVGNFYINRPNTGALVKRHPFGGVKLSGIGSKAGGPDYLLQFMDPKAVIENTLRRGFTPAEEKETS